MKLTVGESTSYENLEVNDQVNAVLASIEPHEFEWEGETINKLKWKFSVLDEGPWKDVTILGTTSTNFTAHPDCKAYNWASAIAGHEFPAGHVFDTDEIVAMRCRILIGHKPDKTGRVWMTVADVMAPRATTLTDHSPADGGKF